MNKTNEVVKMAALFFVIFGCFNGGLTLLSYLYSSIGLGYLGQKNIALIYGGYFISNFFARKFIGFFRELKLSLMVGGFFYAFTMFSAMYAYYCKQYQKFEGKCSKDSVIALNYVSAFLLGFFGPTLIWNAQYAFIDRISSKTEKTKMFGTFYTIF